HTTRLHRARQARRLRCLHRGSIQDRSRPSRRTHAPTHRRRWRSHARSRPAPTVMTEPQRISTRELTSPLSPEQVDLLMPYGEVRSVEVGEVLFHEGDASYSFFVILQGRVGVVDDYGGHERELADGGRGEFVAELNMFTGERLYTTAVVRE